MTLFTEVIFLGLSFLGPPAGILLFVWFSFWFSSLPLVAWADFARKKGCVGTGGMAGLETGGDRFGDRFSLFSVAFGPAKMSWSFSPSQKRLPLLIPYLMITILRFSISADLEAGFLLDITFGFGFRVLGELNFPSDLIFNIFFGGEAEISSSAERLSLACDSLEGSSEAVAVALCTEIIPCCCFFLGRDGLKMAALAEPVSEACARGIPSAAAFS